MHQHELTGREFKAGLKMSRLEEGKGIAVDYTG